MVLAGEHLAANRGGATRLMAAFPRRLFRSLIDLAYRRQIKAEGFGERQVRVAEVIRETANGVSVGQDRRRGGDVQAGGRSE
jgi:hypothetical protein